MGTMSFNREPLTAQGLASTSTGLKATFVLPYCNQKIRLVGILVEGTDANATGFIFDFTWGMAGVTTNQQSTTTNCIAQIKKVASQNQQGQFIYACAAGVAGASASPAWVQTSELFLPAGNVIYCYLTTAEGAACIVDAIVWIEESPEEIGNVTVLATASTPGMVVTT